MILTVEDTNNHFFFILNFVQSEKKTLNRNTHFSLHVIHVCDYFSTTGELF